MLLALSMTGWAEQSTGEVELATFEEVVKVQRSLLLENSFSEQRLGEEKFHIQHPQNLEAILKALPSVSVSESYNGTSGVFFRGADSDKLLVILDGIIMNDPTSPSGGFDFRVLQPSEIEEIKIWSPGEAVSWGPGALGGVLAIKSKRSLQSVANFSIGCLQTAQFGLASGFAQNNWQTIFSYSGLQSQGISAAAPWTGASETDAKARNNLRIQSLREADLALQRIQFLFSEGFENTDRSPAADDPNSTSRYQMSVLHFQDERKPSATSELISSLTLKKTARSESDAPDLLNANFQYSSEEAFELQGRMQYLRSLTESVQLDTGFDFVNSQASFTNLATATPASEFTKHAEEIGGFLRLHHQLPRMKLVPGLRLQTNQESQVNALTSLRFDWQLASQWSFEYHAATGIKHPTIYQRYSSYGRNNLQAEKLEYHHLGFGKTTALAKTLILFFQQWSQDLIQFNSSSLKYENLSTAQLKGIELQVTQDFGRVKVDFSAKETYAFDGQSQPLLRRPRQQITLGSDHFSGKFRFAPLIIWKGAREDQYLTTRVALPSTTQFDIGMNYYAQAHLHIEGALRNIFAQDLTDAYGYQSLGRRAEIGVRYFW